MPVEFVAWPYHAGLRGVGMGRGPEVLAPDAPVVPPVDESLPEIARIFELDRRLAAAVREAKERGAFPFVLAGNCVSALGTTAGVGPEGLGVVWFDAHADFDTPDDNLSGFTDVMGLSILTGTGWKALRETIPGFAPIPEERVVLAAVRDLEPYQRERVEASSLRVVPGRMDGFEAALDALDVERVYLHFDLDAVDAGEARANEYAAPGGPSSDALLAAIDLVFKRFRVEAAALTAYDPGVDPRAGAFARAVMARVTGT
jgi:arginase